MRQAKSQTQNLRQTDDFLGVFMKPGYIEKEREKTKHSQPEFGSARQVNGRPKMPRVDSFSRFSDPPAPPPQQPLPEKPAALSRNGADAISPLKRSDTEKPKPPVTTSPASRESSQILSLIEALSSTKKELESQGARVKELETLLLHERTARESAEEKARRLEVQTDKHGQPSEVAGAFEPPSGTDQAAIAERQLDKIVDTGDSSNVDNGITDAILVNGQVQQPTEDKFQNMVKRMEEMQEQVVAFKDRAQKAEDETVQTRKSLAEMIETLRRERAGTVEPVEKSVAHGLDSAKVSGLVPSCQEHLSTAKESPIGHSLVSSQTTETDRDGAAFATQQQQKQSLVEQSSPYASMLGVVLLGVGLMAYLNGWQKVER